MFWVRGGARREIVHCNIDCDGKLKAPFSRLRRESTKWSLQHQHLHFQQFFEFFPIRCQRADNGVGFLGRRQPASSCGVWGSAVMSPGGVRDKAPAAEKGFLAFYNLEAPDGLSWKLLGAKFGGGPLAPLNPSMTVDTSLVCHLYELFVFFCDVCPRSA